MKRIGKENHHVGGHKLRESLPFKLSSVLKTSNRIEDKGTHFQASKVYEMGKSNCVKKPSTPLIKSNPQKSKNSVLFFKNCKLQHQDSQLLKNCKSSFLNVSGQQAHEECIGTNTLEQIDDKFFDLVHLIHQEKNKPLDRSQSSSSVYFKSAKIPLIVNQKKKKDEIFLPQPTSSHYYSENENEGNYLPFSAESQVEKHSKKNERHHENYLAQSTVLMCSNIDQKISEKRLSQYTVNKKSETNHYRLCINCETYVNKSLALEHQKKCIGFQNILKMSNSQLIDFLDEKINKKLLQLQQIQKHLHLSRQTVKSPKNLSHFQEKNRIDQILTNLDSIRLKALKRLHTKPESK